MLELSKWDLDVETNDREEYTSLVRAVRRTHQRFKLLFVSCSPPQGEKVRCDLMADIPTKKYELLDIKESIDNLYEAINNIPNLAELDVLFIRGLEYSIFEYEDREFGDISKRSQSEVYGGSWAGVPPVLAKLNMQRELFRDRFPHICFVFLLPHFAIDYFIRRAPDFYDWKSGIYRLKTDAEDLRSQIFEILDSEYRKQYNLLNSKEKLSKISEIRACLDEIEDLDRRWQLLSQLSILYIICDRYSLAIYAFKQILEIRPDDYKALFQYGTSLDNLGKYEDSIACYDRVIELKPDLYEAWFNRGVSLSILKQYKEATDSYDRAIEINSDLHQHWNNRGMVLGILGRYEEAISSFDRAIHLKPGDDAAWNNRGNALNILGKYEEAIADFDRAVEIKPDNYAAWNNRASVLNILGKYEAEIDSYNRALKINSEDRLAWFNSAIALGDLGRYEEAIYRYDRALQIRPEDHYALHNKGVALDNLGRYQESIDIYNRALQFQPNAHHTFRNKGRALYKCGKYQESLNAYEKAVSINPDIYSSWHDGGFVLFHLGKYKEALNAWKEAFNIISKLKPRNTSDLIQEFLDEQLLPKFQQPAVRDILPQILTIYSTAQVLPEFGVALTRNLKAIQSPTISDYTAIEWLKMWQELGKPHPELALALRMLEAGIKYKQNPTDDRVFLSLPQEMRPLLREALGLEP